MSNRGWVYNYEHLGRGIRSCCVDHEWNFHGGNWTRTGGSDVLVNVEERQLLDFPILEDLDFNGEPEQSIIMLKEKIEELVGQK